MRVVFICGSMEPGRDGVGDYTRRLSAEFLCQGYQVNVIALHDRHLRQSMINETQYEEGHLIPTLRLSSRLSWKDRTNQALALISDVNPCWISLQYVPFSFHDKGLSINLAKVIKQMSNDRYLHIMFHEIWLGLSKQSTIQHIIWGKLQQYLISSLVKTCNSEVMHTHTQLYQSHLSNLNIRTTILPLFTNIPVSNYQKKPQKFCDQIRFVFFGGIAPNAPIQNLALEAAEYAESEKKILNITFIGHNGPELNNWVSIWKAHNAKVDVLGVQTPKQISETLSNASIGISTTPFTLVSKSGAIAAMHAHGLPVICISAPWHSRFDKDTYYFNHTSNYVVGMFKGFMQLSKTENVRGVSIDKIVNLMTKEMTFKC